MYISSDIINLEKVYFSNLQSSFDKFLSDFKNTKKLNINKSKLVELLELNKKINELELYIDKLRYKIKKNNQLDKNNIDNSEYIENYEKDRESINKILPLLIYYRMTKDA